MFNFLHFHGGGVWEGGLPAPQVITFCLYIVHGPPTFYVGRRPWLLRWISIGSICCGCVEPYVSLPISVENTALFNKNLQKSALLGTF